MVSKTYGQGGPAVHALPEVSLSGRGRDSSGDGTERLVQVHAAAIAGSLEEPTSGEVPPRWVYKIEPDPVAPEYKIFHLHKCSVAVAEDLRYRIVGDGHMSRIEWVDRAQVERGTGVAVTRRCGGARDAASAGSAT
jgi:hypothetical protein